jgi:2'-5' RNA ligase superfamily protein
MSEVPPPGAITASEETALLIPFPALEAPLRAYQGLDPAVSFGVPRHVTLLGPFAPLELLASAARAALRSLFASVAAFRCSFPRTAWFGEEVLFLMPEPRDVFVELTSQVWRLFPDYPPYGGAFAEIVPHLTVGISTTLADREASTAEMRRAEAGLAPLLPLTGTADRALLMAGRREPNGWRVVAEFPFAPSDTREP